MIIAVSMRVVSSTPYPEVRDAISHDWTRFLDGAGVVPVFVPNALAAPDRYLDSIGARGLILTGGDDIGPIDGEAGAAQPPMARDRTERLLLQWATAAARPVLGVCRGLQLINSHFGGRICRNVAAFASHENVSHVVDLRDLPEVGSATPVTVNSYHRQAVLSSDIAAPLRVFGSCGDVVEGLRHRTLPIVAVQWHPERVNPAADLDRRLLTWWLSLCK